MGLVLLVSGLGACSEADQREAKETAGNAAEQAKQTVDDATVTATVKTKLAADDRTPATTINVDTKDGVVTLKGTVESQEAKSRAETIAKGVEGVKSVRNELAVETAADVAKDKAIKDSVTANLGKAGVRGVDVEVSRGVVTLKGRVPKASIQPAVRAANDAVPKPIRVENELTSTG
jgi:hyperosmotically inducible periplasmic protein